MGGPINSDSDVVITTDDSTPANDDDQLLKALDGAIDVVSQSLQKAKSSQSTDDDDTDDYDVDDDSDVSDVDDDKKPPKKKKKMGKSMRIRDDVADDEPDFSALSKSIPDTIREDVEAGEILDAMPLVAAIADAMEEQITAVTKAVVLLTDKMERLELRMAKSQKLDIATAQMLKSVRNDVKAFGDLPLPRKSVVNTQDLQIMKKSGNKTTKTTLKKSEALDKLTVLCKSGKLTVQEATMAEGRIQKGLTLPAKVTWLLLDEEVA